MLQRLVALDELRVDRGSQAAREQRRQIDRHVRPGDHLVDGARRAQRGGAGGDVRVAVRCARPGLHGLGAGHDGHRYVRRPDERRDLTTEAAVRPEGRDDGGVELAVGTRGGTRDEWPHPGHTERLVERRRAGERCVDRDEIGDEARQRVVVAVTELDRERVHAPATDPELGRVARTSRCLETDGDRARAGRIGGEQVQRQHDLVEHRAEALPAGRAIEGAAGRHRLMGDDADRETGDRSIDSEAQREVAAERRPGGLRGERQARGGGSSRRRPGRGAAAHDDARRARKRGRCSSQLHRVRSSTQSPTGSRRNPHDS